MLFWCLATAAGAQNSTIPAAMPAVSPTAHNEWLPEFTQVKISAAIEVTFVHAAVTEAPRIAYDTKGADDTRFKASVDKKGVLTISERVPRDKRSETQVTVYYHTLESLSVSDAWVVFSQPVDQQMVALTMSGGARLTAEVDVKDMEVTLTGKNTQLTLSGSAKYLEAEVSSGKIDASKLVVMNAEIEASYSADVRLDVTDRLKASATSSAKVSYSGRPSIVKVRESYLGGSVKSVE